ncbi:hypothetical protein RKD46_001587 [Streptomyces pseudovenezuelae]
MPGPGVSRSAAQECVCRMVSFWEPSEPHTTGPTPGSSLGPTTAAPAPSPNRNAVWRSVGSRSSESRSTAMTRTWRALPAVIMSEARDSP